MSWRRTLCPVIVAQLVCNWSTILQFGGQRFDYRQEYLSQGFPCNGPGIDFSLWTWKGYFLWYPLDLILISKEKGCSIPINTSRSQNARTPRYCKQGADIVCVCVCVCVCVWGGGWEVFKAKESLRGTRTWPPWMCASCRARTCWTTLVVTLWQCPEPTASNMQGMVTLPDQKYKVNTRRSGVRWCWKTPFGVARLGLT